MKNMLSATLVVLIVVVNNTASIAGPTVPMYIPNPTTTASRAVKLAGNYLERHRTGGAFSVISVQWNTPTRFTPHYSNGIQWNFNEAPREWSWFITYTVPSMKPQSNMGQKGQVDIHVLRIRGDDSLEEPIGIN